MNLQKYHAHGGTRETTENGAVRVTGRTMWGEHLAKVENCPCYSSGGEYLFRRTVYVRGEADTFFTIPAAIRVGTRAVKGFLTSGDHGLYFVRQAEQ